MFIVGSLSTAANAATLSLVGTSTMVCQLIGETIWDTGTPGTATAAKTLSNFGLKGIDLGFPVDSGSGPLFFLFGDGVLPDHPPTVYPQYRRTTRSATRRVRSRPTLQLALTFSLPLWRRRNLRIQP